MSSLQQQGETSPAFAWVPDDEERSWDLAAELASDWIWERSELEGRRPLLVTNTLKNASGIESLEEIAHTCGQATPQSSRRSDFSPVLAYVPDERTLGLALRLSRGYSLVVVEGFSFPIREWAAKVGAIDLTDGSEAESELEQDVLESLDRAVFFGGNNGWSGQHEKKHARNVLEEHLVKGALTPEGAAAYVMSRGVSETGAKRLRALLEKMRQ